MTRPRSSSSSAGPIAAPTADQLVALYHKHRLIPMVGDFFGHDRSGRLGADVLGLLLVEAIGLGLALDLDDAELPEVLDPATGTDRSTWDAVLAELPWPDAWLESLHVGWIWSWCGSPRQDLVPAGAIPAAYRVGREASRILVGPTPAIRSLRTARVRGGPR